MVILLKILLHIIFCFCTGLLFCYWKRFKLWNHFEVVCLISLFKSLHKNISSLQVIQLPKIRPPVYFQWSYGKFHDFQCPTEAVRCFPSHGWLGPSRRMKVFPCQAMQSVEANLDDLDDLHVVPQIWQMGFLREVGWLWFQFLITMQQKIEAFRICSHLGLANLLLSDDGFLAWRPMWVFGFQVTLRKPKDDVWACTARSDGRCQRHAIVMGFRSHDLPFLGFWHKLIGK